MNTTPPKTRSGKPKNKAQREFSRLSDVLRDRWRWGLTVYKKQLVRQITKYLISVIFYLSEIGVIVNKFYNKYGAKRSESDYYMK